MSYNAKGDSIKLEDIKTFLENYYKENKTTPKLTEWKEKDGFPCNKQNLYPLKAKVYHNNKYWQSIVYNNIWEPSVNGWEEVT